MNENARRRPTRPNADAEEVPVTDLELVLVGTGALVLFLGVWSNYLRRATFVPEPFVALLAGVLLGPAVLGVLDPGTWGDERTIVREAARLTLAVALMAVALRLPPDYVQRHGRAFVVMVALVLPLAWLTGGLLTAVILGVPLWLALVVGAALAPTDPIVTTTIMVGDFAEERLPPRVRELLSMEAGANDGLAMPLLMLPVLASTMASGAAGRAWLLESWLWEIGAALVVGAALGVGAGRMLTWSEERDLIERHSFLAYSLALTLLTLGLAEAAGTEGLAAVFVAGLAFTSTVGGAERSEEESVQEAISQFFYLPVFTLVGLVLPWEAWKGLGPQALVLVVAVLALRRLPAVLLFATPLRSLPTPRDRLYVGWFGPIGISTVLLALVAVDLTGEEIVWTVGSLMVFVSTAVHGVSANPLTRVYARRGEARQGGAAAGRPSPEGAGQPAESGRR
jgi:sodium/hydrogen antiporter